MTMQSEYIKTTGDVAAKPLLLRWLSYLIPVNLSNIAIFLPLFCIKLLVSFNYTVLQATKDTVVVSVQGGGAEVIPVLKGGAVIFIAFLFMLLYSKLSNKLSPDRLFYAVILPFLFFFLLYGCVLFPHRDLIAPHASADALVNFIGTEHAHWVYLYRYWMNALFFVAAELWGAVVIGVLFWSFANQVSSVQDAAKFYVLYTAGGHIGTITGGLLTAHLFAENRSISYETKTGWIMYTVFIIGLIIIASFAWISRYIKTSDRFNDQTRQKILAKTSLSLTSSLKYVLSSKYLGLMVLLVVGYGMSISLVEVIWKAILKIKFTSPEDYAVFTGKLQYIVGSVAFVMAFLGAQIINRYGWRLAALLSPLCLGTVTIMFFGIYFFYPDNLATKITILAFFGAIHNVLCKSMKYCFFDPTREMAYLPLDQEGRVKGKAAVDLVGSRFGKSGSAWVQILLIDSIGCGSILNVVNFIFPIVLVIVAIWYYAVNKLANKIEQLN